MATTRRPADKRVPRDSEGKALPLVWVGIDEHNAEFANQAMVQFHDGEFFLSFGQATPPPILGTLEEQRAQLEATDFVPVRVVSRVALTPDKIRQLITAMSNTLKTYDGQQRSAP